MKKCNHKYIFCGGGGGFINYVVLACEKCANVKRINY